MLLRRMKLSNSHPLTEYVSGLFLGGLFALDCLIDLFAMNADILRCVYAQPYLIAAHIDNGNFNVIAYDYRLILLSAQNQHFQTPLSCLRTTLPASVNTPCGYFCLALCQKYIPFYIKDLPQKTSSAPHSAVA